ncbi:MULTISPECIES: hypothetical protein [unclassified Streptomyces]|uniref:hypothetical protein n=1 Tax=unclassified Streptomyces TaxID=2593676 RepID=UPI00224E08F8|nr:MULTISPECIES: hypothetical protein [unclassified Streptomyces]MCX4779798.1 hypothetical protein [Streptomyces sp. NBC_01264]WSK21467.1 hypothetical protein OG730_20180 [Streptomyces sp. NBC_01298]
MSFDPYLALNAMLRAEAARFSPPAPPVRQPEPESAKTAQTTAEAPAGDDTAA